MYMYRNSQNGFLTTKWEGDLNRVDLYMAKYGRHDKKNLVININQIN